MHPAQARSGYIANPGAAVGANDDHGRRIARASVDDAVHNPVSRSR
jgi:hypothetical protein